LGIRRLENGSAKSNQNSRKEKQEKNQNNQEEFLTKKIKIKTKVRKLEQEDGFRKEIL